jgi:hypothetical protein
MPCPYLKEVVMLYCDAYQVKKMVPLDRLVSAEPCLARGFRACPLFVQAGGACVEPQQGEPASATKEASR